MRCLAIAVVFLLFVTSAIAQVPPAPYIPPSPILNPSAPYVVPQAPPVPVSSDPGFSPGSDLAGTDQVVNPPRSVFHARHKRRHHYVRAMPQLSPRLLAAMRLTNGRLSPGRNW
jgi:hypothetical protein